MHVLLIHISSMNVICNYIILQNICYNLFKYIKLKPLILPVKFYNIKKNIHNIKITKKIIVLAIQI